MLSKPARGSVKEPQSHRKPRRMSGNNLRRPKGYPRATQELPKGYLRDTQGTNTGATPAQHRSNTVATPCTDAVERVFASFSQRSKALFRLANGALLSQNCPMQSHELLREVFQRYSPKQVSAKLGLSLSMIYKWAEPGNTDTGSGSTNPLDRIDALIQCTNDPRLVQWVCQRAGG